MIVGAPKGLVSSLDFGLSKKWFLVPYGSNKVADLEKLPPELETLNDAMTVVLKIFTISFFCLIEELQDYIFRFEISHNSILLAVSKSETRNGLKKLKQKTYWVFDLKLCVVRLRNF